MKYRIRAFEAKFRVTIFIKAILRNSHLCFFPVTSLYQSYLFLTSHCHNLLTAISCKIC